ncbi:siderophore-interacting protein [Microbacterium sp. NIBRBAC000506063]|uniref:siderophore-interacting protein n=1 Tax=Microbacterium sp. NIBRBAC000506063 TaxID=2734618 RepID=UPI0021D3F51C|nr:siderophore-interacting protein [Microbacterium sp. NIBRBAC000506063]
MAGSSTRRGCGIRRPRRRRDRRPAIARILEDAPRDLRGIAFLEVPLAEDALEIAAPAGVEVHWLPRGDVNHGLRLLPTVLDYLGGSTGARGRPWRCATSTARTSSGRRPSTPGSARRSPPGSRRHPQTATSGSPARAAS